MAESMKIPLTKGKFAIVDADLYDRLMRQKWYAIGPKKNGQWYAQCRYGPPRLGPPPYDVDVTGPMLLMHRVIMQTPEDMETDHRNHNGLDNRRVNLRICTKSQNLMNQRPRKGGSSAFKGVTRRGVKWGAQIRVGGKQKCLGVHQTETEAAEAYNKAAIEYFGEFAHLNAIEGAADA